MLSYESAKKKAIEVTQEAGVVVNWAGELPDAYVFNDSEHQYDGLLPIVIRKSDGKAFNYWHYLVQANEYSEHVKELKF